MQVPLDIQFNESHNQTYDEKCGFEILYLYLKSERAIQTLMS